MRSEKEIDKMYDFIGFFNDGVFMSHEYRRGLLDALSFSLGWDNKLKNYKEKLTKLLVEQHAMRKMQETNETNNNK